MAVISQIQCRRGRGKRKGVVGEGKLLKGTVRGAREVVEGRGQGKFFKGSSARSSGKGKWAGEVVKGRGQGKW